MTEALSIDFQSDWWDIVDGCGLSINAICEDYDFKRKSFMKWLRCEAVPRDKNRERIIAAMSQLVEEKKLVKHPSYGYATPDQIKELSEIGMGPRRDYLLKQIEKQTKLAGKKR
ncbi:hypothetical protein [Hymenobacter fodinae]|nr:hypothetical protein [Hymenobacter fodinae]